MNTVVVYDDETQEAKRRHARITALFGALKREGALPEMPGIVLTTRRHECFAALEASDCGLLIADLFSSDGSAKGARVLRAVAGRAGVAERITRVALTRRTHPDVAVDLSLKERAHAVVVFPPDADTTSLRDAVLAVLNGEVGPGLPSRVFPSGMADRHDAEVDVAMRAALFLDPGETYTSRNAHDAFLAIRDADGIDDEQALNDARARIYRLIRRKRGPFPPDQLLAHLRSCLAPVDAAGLSEPIKSAHVRVLLERNVPKYIKHYGPTQGATWLSQKELVVARAFLNAARDSKVAGSASNRLVSLDDVLIDDEYIRERDSWKLTDSDTAYAVASLADWIWDAGLSMEELDQGKVAPG